MVTTVLISIVAVIVGGSYVLIFSRLFKTVAEERGRHEKAKERFYKELKRRIDLGVIQNLDDVTLIQRSIAAEERSDLLAVEELAVLLEGYLLKVSERDEFQFVKSLLEVERTEKPYSILSDRERAIAETLKKTIEAQQRELSLAQLQELTASLGVKLQAAYEEVSSSRMWTRLGAIGTVAGLVLAVALGLAGFLT